jgi:hypothetical protein
MSPLIIAGDFIRNIAIWVQIIANFAANVALAVALLLLLVRFLVDRFDYKPFSRLTYYVRRPTNRWFYEIKGSQLYKPIRQAFGFDPIWVLLLLAFVVLFFLLRGLVSYTTTLLSCVGATLISFGDGDPLIGGKALMGTLLLSLIYFLMALMTILVINSWFGLFDRAAFWAGRRIYPILRTVDVSGQLGPIIFIVAFLILSFLAQAVLTAFF